MYKTDIFVAPTTDFGAPVEQDKFNKNNEYRSLASEYQPTSKQDSRSYCGHNILSKCIDSNRVTKSLACAMDHASGVRVIQLEEYFYNSMAPRISNRPKLIEGSI